MTINRRSVIKILSSVFLAPYFYFKIGKQPTLEEKMSKNFMHNLATTIIDKSKCKPMYFNGKIIKREINERFCESINLYSYSSWNGFYTNKKGHNGDVRNSMVVTVLSLLKSPPGITTEEAKKIKDLINKDHTNMLHDLEKDINNVEKYVLSNKELILYAV
jgi:hypothetical protein